MMELASVNTCRNFLQRTKPLLQQAHIRFIENVTVIEMDLEERESKLERESVRSEFSVPCIRAITKVPEWCIDLTVSFKKTHGLAEL